MRIQNRIQICIDADIISQVDMYALKNGFSRSMAIRQLLKKALEKES